MALTAGELQSLTSAIADLVIDDADLAGIENPYDAALWLAAQISGEGVRVTFLPRAEPL